MRFSGWQFTLATFKQDSQRKTYVKTIYFGSFSEKKMYQQIDNAKNEWDTI